MKDSEFRAMLQASRERNKHNSTLTQTTPPATKSQPLPNPERKTLKRSFVALRHETEFMPVRKTTKNTIKNYLANFDSYEQLPSKFDDIFIGFCRSVGRPPKYNKNYFIF